MKNIDILVTFQIGGDRMTALSETLFIAKATKATLFLKFSTYSITVHPESYLTDLYEISNLEERLIKIKKMNKEE